MRSLRSDLGLEGDDSRRYLPWLVGVMMYLAALALVGALSLGTAAQRWQAGVAGSLTVQLAAPASETEARLAASRLEAALAIIRQTEGVVRAEALTPTQIAALLEPLLGDPKLIAELPLPQLIDVTLANGARLDTAALTARLATAAPGAVVDDHGRWLASLARLARTGWLLAAAIVILTGLATAATVVFTTRTGLAIHHEAIELLHLMGASDGFIARQFEREATLQGLVGGIVGVLAAGATMAAIGAFAGAIDLPVVGRLVVSTDDVGLLLLLPLAAALVALVTARLVVLRALARMP